MAFNTSSVNASSLMKSILIERFKDISIQENLCRQLLDVAEINHDTYATSFANLYLFDAILARGGYEEARFYLLRTQTLCEQYKYKDLLMVFHNIAGLYYRNITDEISALNHYLKGLDLAQELNDSIIESKIYNNLGILFLRRHDLESGLNYFNSAYETIKDFMSEDTQSTVVSFLCNAAEVYRIMEDVENSAVTLEKAQVLSNASEYSYLLVRSAWCGHYSISNEREKCLSIAKEMLDEGLSDFEHAQLVVSVYFENFGHMLRIECKEYAYRYLSLLEATTSIKNIGDYYTYIRCKLQFYECYGSSAECEQVYQEYYEINLKMNELNNSIHIKNVLSKIDLSKVLFEIKSLYKEKVQLENVSHIDELTQLYNRRYITKMQSKVRMKEQQKTIGFVMIDVDYFKEYNDFYGHFKGDKALQCVASLLKKNEDQNIYASRYGGDEFLVLFVNHTKEQIIKYIENVQMELKQ